MQVSVAPRVPGAHRIQLHREAPLACARHYRPGCPRVREPGSRSPGHLGSPASRGNGHLGRAGHLRSRPPNCATRFERVSLIPRILKDRQDCGESLRRDLDTFVPPVLVIHGNPGILRAAEEVWVSHSPIIDPSQGTCVAGPPGYAMIRKTFRTPAIKAFPDNAT